MKIIMKNGVKSWRIGILNKTPNGLVAKHDVIPKIIAIICKNVNFLCGIQKINQQNP